MKHKLPFTGADLRKSASLGALFAAFALFCCLSLVTRTPAKDTDGSAARQDYLKSMADYSEHPASFNLHMAVTITVTNNNDNGPGSLRQAVIDSASGGTIDFSGSVITPITLTSGEIVIDKDLTIQGPGANLLTVRRDPQAAARFRIFTVTSGVKVNISGLTITGGYTNDGSSGPAATGGVEGGGIRNSGTLSLTGVAVTAHQTGNGGTGTGGTTGGSGGPGGGIYNTGTLTIINSTISGNQTGNGGNSAGGTSGPGGNGGGIFNNGTLTTTNSTISGNQTGATGTGAINTLSADGGGIFNGGGEPDIFAVTSGNTLIRFNAATPANVTTVGPIMGITGGYTIVGIDFRPSTGQLYGLGFNFASVGTEGRLYTINTDTAMATAVGAGFPMPNAIGSTLNAATGFGFDFNPVADMIRVVSSGRDNFRINPTTAARSSDTILTPAGSIAVGAAYTNNFAGATSTTLYDIDISTNPDRLVVQGGNPVPPGASPNGGVLTAVGPLGIDSADSNLSFDIYLLPDGSNRGLAALTTNGTTSGLYTVNLASGAATLVGTIGGATPVLVRGMSALSATLTLSNSTITANTVNTATGTGGGISSNGGVVILRSTIVAGNSAGGGGPDIRNSVQSQGYNLIGNTDGSTVALQATDLSGTGAAPLDPKLGPLASNGGPTQTHALQPNSPAIDKGKNFAVDASNNPINTDQRGVQRPIDLPIANAAGGDGSDIGAFEMIQPIDFGDAPDPTYPTLLASNGARHAIVAGFSLGATVDSESDGNPSSDATGDGADEDGVTIPNPMTACVTTNINVSLTNTAGLATPRLDAWIDFNRDGDFNDAGEQIATSLALVSGANSVPVNVPCGAVPGNSFARFRLSSTGGLSPTGSAADGEVEDYSVTINQLADLAVTKTDAPDPVTAGNNIVYTIIVSNNGPGNATTATLTDALPANTTFQSITAPAGWICTTPAVNAGGTVSCTNASLANGASGTFILVVNVKTGTANGTISNTATVSTSVIDPVAGNNSSTATTTVAEVVSPAPTGQAPKALLVKPAAGNTTAGAGVSDSSCVAPTGVTVAGVFANINQALGAANTGDTIYVCPKYTAGLVVPYVEQVSLGFTNLSVVGISDVRGSRAVIAANPSTATSPTTQIGTNYIVQIVATGVNFGNFVVDGAPGGTNFTGTGIFNGIAVRRSGAFVFNNTVQNIKTTDTATNANGQGIAVFGAGSAGSPLEAGTIANPVNILNNVVQKFRSNGVNVSAGSSSAYAFVRGNYIIGNSNDTTVILQNLTAQSKLTANKDAADVNAEAEVNLIVPVATVAQTGVHFETGANGDIFNNRISSFIFPNQAPCIPGPVFKEGEQTNIIIPCIPVPAANAVGIRLDTTGSTSANPLRVRFNSISKTQMGIFGENVQYVNIASNTITGSDVDGVHLQGSAFNLGSNFCTINQNTILTARRAGVFIGLIGGDASLGNNLTQNTIEDTFTGVANNTPAGNNTISTTGATANTFISVNNFVSSASSGVNDVQNTNPLP